jgi:phosphate acyltransferase
MARIAVDVMGGDRGPAELVRGALTTAAQQPNDIFCLVGDEKVINEEIARVKPAPTNLKIIPTQQVVDMHDSPVDAIRYKKDSSLVKAITLVAQGEADAIISVGNTGAVVAGATFLMGFLEGVKRPGIAIPLPTDNGVTYLIDVGANIYCNPVHLLQYGIMASVYCSSSRQIKSPRVGLLNIGSEENKGNELVKYTSTLLKKSHLNFVGNVEGQDIFKGVCDVLVCEGFVGNVLLKQTEGLFEFLLRTLHKELMKTAVPGQNNEGLQSAGSGTGILGQAVGKLKSLADYSEHGGAPLLGVKGVCIICHGRSEARAFSNALKVATKLVESKVTQSIQQAIQESHLSWFDMLKSWRAHSTNN